MKANQQVEPIINLEAGTVTMRFADPDLADVTLFVRDQVHANMREYAAYVGFANVRLADGGAVERMDKKTGRVRTDAEMLRMKWERINRLADHYNSGIDQWRLVVAAEGAAETGLTVEAIARARGITVAEADAQVSALAEKRGEDRKTILAALRSAEPVAEAIDAIRAERRAKAPKKADANNLLAEMG